MLNFVKCFSVSCKYRFLRGFGGRVAWIVLRVACCAVRVLMGDISANAGMAAKTQPLLPDPRPTQPDPRPTQHKTC
jgi:hypothetical protein